MQEYIDNGAKLGWLIDSKTQKVEIYHLGKQVEILQNPAILSGERRYTTRFYTKSKLYF